MNDDDSMFMYYGFTPYLNTKTSQLNELSMRGLCVNLKIKSNERKIPLSSYISTIKDKSKVLF